MKITKKEGITILEGTTSDLIDFIEKINYNYSELKKQNLIVDLSNYEINKKQFSHFKALIALHKKTKKSFILVHKTIFFDDLPNYLVLVPTIQEAFDMIEMDEIERDLGF